MIKKECVNEKLCTFTTLSQAFTYAHYFLGLNLFVMGAGLFSPPLAKTINALNFAK